MKLKEFELTKEENKQLVELKSILCDIYCFSHNISLETEDETLLDGYKKTELVSKTMLSWFDKFNDTPLGALMLLAFRESMKKQEYLIKCEEAAREFGEAAAEDEVRENLKNAIDGLRGSIQKIIKELDKEE